MTEEYSKKLCMKELRIQRCRLDNSHFYETGGRSPDSAFIFVVRGELELLSVNKRYKFESGTLVFIPEGSRYSSYLHGEDGIEFYTLQIINNHPDTSGASYSLGAVSGLSNPDTEVRIARIFELMSSGGRVEKVRAIGLYYELYADALPLLEPCEPVKLSPSLLAAVDYIDAHYSEDFDIDTLAANSHISASRLSHLFRIELGTTPVKLRLDYRIEHAAEQLRSSERPISEIAERCGFNSLVYFDKAFRRITGFTPGEYRAMTLGKR